MIRFETLEKSTKHKGNKFITQIFIRAKEEEMLGPLLNARFQQTFKVELDVPLILRNSKSLSYFYCLWESDAYGQYSNKGRGSLSSRSTWIMGQKMYSHDWVMSFSSVWLKVKSRKERADQEGFILGPLILPIGWLDGGALINLCSFDSNLWGFVLLGRAACEHARVDFHPHAPVIP